MIFVVLLLFLTQWSANAVPMIRDMAPVVIGGLEGVLIEVPEYEDPELFDAIGAVPIMSLIQLPKSGLWSQTNRNKNMILEEKDTMAEAKSEIGDIVKKLKMIHSKTQPASGRQRQEELSKAFYGIKNLENGQDVHSLLKFIKQSLPQPKPNIVSGTKRPIMPTLINDYVGVETQRPKTSEDGVPDNTDYDSDEFDDE